MRRNPKLRWLVPLLLVTAVIGIATAVAVPEDGDETLSAEEIAALERYADRFQRAQELMGGGKDAESSKILRELIAERDDVAEVHHALAIVLRYQGRADEATRAFLRATELSPEDAIIARDAGLDLLERGFLADAKALLGKSMRLDGNDLETALGFGTALRRLGETDAAVKALEAAVALEEGSLDAHVGLAFALVRTDPVRAGEIVAPLNHNFSDVCVVHGLALEKTGRRDAARAQLLGAARLAAPSAGGREILMEATEALVRCADVAGVVEAAGRWCAVDATPTQGPGLRPALALAAGLAAQGDAAGAVKVLDGARPGGESLGVRLHTAVFAAVLLRRAGRADDAAQILSPIAELETDLFERAAAQRLIGRLDEATFAAEAERPGRANDVAFIEAEVARAEGRHDDAAKLIDRTRELSDPPGEYPGLLVQPVSAEPAGNGDEAKDTPPSKPADSGD